MIYTGIAILVLLGNFLSTLKIQKQGKEETSHHHVKTKFLFRVYRSWKKLQQMRNFTRQEEQESKLFLRPLNSPLEEDESLHVANETTSMKFAKKWKKIALSFCSCQCNFSIARKKIIERHNLWCHLYELIAFPEVGILVSENKLLIQVRQMSSSQVPCNSLSLKLGSVLSSVLWWTKSCSKSEDSGAACGFFSSLCIFEYSKYLF